MQDQWMLVVGPIYNGISTARHPEHILKHLGLIENGTMNAEEDVLDLWMCIQSHSQPQH
jgi:hypothetical protein